MARNLTQYTGGAAVSAGGGTIGQWVGDETTYLAIQDVSDPASDNYDEDADNFDPNFAHTLYFIYEDQE